MAFLAHSIPWESVSSKLEFVSARSKSGPQHERFSFKQQPGSLTQLEYFGRKFRDVVKEHSANERRKFYSPDIYVDRAKGWKVSEPECNKSTEPQDVTVGTKGTDHSDAARIQRNQELRNMQNNLARGAWPASSETRMVYSQDLIDKYLNAPNWSAKRKYDLCFLKNQVGSKIQDWIALVDYRSSSLEPKEDQTYWGRAIIELDHADVIKLLITEAVIAPQADRRHYITETIFLLAHHPQVELEKSVNQSMSCCNIWCGFDNIAVFAVEMFLFLNFLVLMRDAGVTEITTPRDTTVVFDRGVRRDITTQSHWSWGPLDYVELMPRPNYMNTTMWLNLMREVCSGHEHQAEKLLFSLMFFPPRAEDGKAVEIDVLSNRTLLKEHMKTLWKVIITSDMILREVGRPLSWEYIVLSTLRELFGWLPDIHWVTYSNDRRGWHVPDEDKTPEHHDFGRYESVK